MKRRTILQNCLFRSHASNQRHADRPHAFLAISAPDATRRALSRTERSLTKTEGGGS
jgi:hypothetical protein